SGDPGQEYFEDGMTDELITSLGKISALKVIARSSVMGYKGTHQPVRDIARALNVGALLEGSALQPNDRVRITPQLIRSPTAPPEARRRARAAAHKALQRDPDHAQAHAMLGFILAQYDWDFARADAELKQAVDLGASNALAHTYYGHFLTEMGRFAEARAQLR